MKDCESGYGEQFSLKDWSAGSRAEKSSKVLGKSFSQYNHEVDQEQGHEEGA